MKKGLLLLIGLMTLVSMNANDFEKSTTATTIIKGYDETVTFIERGVKFHVFLNGDFDFTNPNRNRYYNGNRYSNRSFRIDRDYKGRIKRIGRNYIRYDYRGNVTKIGNIRLYYRNGLLRKVGHLKISYNDWGDAFYHGEVKYNNDYYDDGFNFSFNLSFGDICDYNDPYFYRREFRNNYNKFKEDRNYYYYKARPNAKIGKRNKIIKRRKSRTNTRDRIRGNKKYQKRKVIPRSKIKSNSKRRTDSKKQENSRRRS